MSRFVQQDKCRRLVKQMEMISDFHPHGYIRLPPSGDKRQQYWTCIELLRTFNKVKCMANGKTYAIYLQGLYWKYVNEIYNTYGTSEANSILSSQRFLEDTVKAGLRLLTEVSQGGEEGFTAQFYQTYFERTYPEVQRFFAVFSPKIQNIS